MNTADVLDRAAQIIETHGLHPGEYWPGAGAGPWQPGLPCCIAGAIAVAAGNTGSHTTGEFAYAVATHPAFLKLANHLGYDHNPARVIGWADHPSRTAEQVVAVLRECAEKERRE